VVRHSIAPDPAAPSAVGMAGATLSLAMAMGIW
jgi:hypothetical protein